MSDLDSRISEAEALLENNEALIRAKEDELEKYQFLKALKKNLNGNGLRFCAGLMKNYLYLRLHPSRLPATEYRCMESENATIPVGEVIYEVLDELFDEGLWTHLNMSDTQFPMNWDTEFGQVLNAVDVDKQLSLMNQIASQFCGYFGELSGGSFEDFLVERINGHHGYFLPT